MYLDILLACIDFKIMEESLESFSKLNLSFSKCGELVMSLIEFLPD